MNKFDEDKCTTDAPPPKKVYTDTELLDWLQDHSIDCPGLINDDNGRWAVSFTGTQNVPMEDGPADIWTSYFVEKHEWKPTVREAIIAAIESEEKDE